MSAPFVDQTFDFPQPDGTIITVRGTGNQDRARFETLDGRPLERNADGRWVEVQRPAPGGIGALSFGADEDHSLTSPLADRSSRWEKRRREVRRPPPARVLGAPMAFSPPSRQTRGTFVGLTVLVDFSDDPATIPRKEVEDFCNKAGYSGFGNNGSVADYFRDVSGGHVNYTNVVLPYYRAKKPKRHYADLALPAASRIKQFTRRAQDLIREALQHHLAAGTNLGVLSADSKSFILALNVFYAGGCPNAWSEGIWPHQSTLATPIALPGGRKFADYQITDMGAQLSLGTFCHENGHMICDFPDLYSYVKNNGNGAGNFCLMCFGANADPRNPVHVSAYLKNEAGWGNAVTAAPGNASLTAGNSFLLHRRNADEYFIVENRQRSGRDAALPGSGLAVWHVDEKGSNNRPQSAPHNHYECALVQADGLTEIENGLNAGEARDLFAGPAAVFSRGWRNDPAPPSLTIDKISGPAPTMTFRIR